MSSRSLSAFLFCALLQAQPRVLRVCADPNNLPFSDQAQRGFENRLAQLIAADLGAELQYTWWPGRRSFLRQTLNAGLCDTVMGVPSMLGSVLVTEPYYKSTFVFVSTGNADTPIRSLSDPRLKSLRIGIHLGGEGYAPPAYMLAKEGLAEGLAGYSLYGAGGEPNPSSRLIRAVAEHEVDLAIVWGPIAGYFAKSQSVPLRISPVTPQKFEDVPFTYSVSVATRKEDAALRSEIQAVLRRRCGQVAAILREFAVPVIEEVPCRSEHSLPDSVSLR